MNLVIDIGNTRTKAALFHEKELERVDVLNELNKAYLESLNEAYGTINICVSAVKEYDSALFQNASEGLCIELDHTTALPIINRYATPETLGNDRLASVIGAQELHAGGNVLVVDAGTCLKFDYLSSSLEYLGGAISPGLRMRFKALNKFTGQLPLIEAEEAPELIGDSTKNSILSGVVNGMCAEIDQIIGSYENKYPELMVYMTGGDYGFFDSQLKSEIFAAPYLVLRGLNAILNYNLKNIT